MILIWYRDQEEVRGQLYGDINQLLLGMDRYNYMTRRITTDLTMMLQQRDHAPSAGKLMWNYMNEMIATLDQQLVPTPQLLIDQSIKQIRLEIAISKDCNINPLVMCWENLNDDIAYHLDKRPHKCWNMLSKSDYYTMLSPYFEQQVVDKTYCLSQFHFKSRMFPVFKIVRSQAEHYMVMYLPPYITNEWMFPFTLDQLFTQHVSQNQCYNISDRRLVANKQTEDPDMVELSYDTSDDGQEGQCACNQSFFNTIEDIEPFMFGCINGYIALYREKYGGMNNQITQLTTFDVIVTQSQTGRFRLLDINNGGNFGIPQPIRLCHFIANTDDSHAVPEYNKLARIPMSEDLIICPGMNIVYGYKVRLT